MVVREIATEAEIDRALAAVKESLMRRINKHGNTKFVSIAEAAGKMLEEWDEMVDELRTDDDNRILDEMMDIAIVAVWSEVSFRQSSGSKH